MTSHRTIFSTLVLVAALSATAPVSASANSLLSGYGGPGQGNQAILGSALLNGPGAGGGSAESSPVSSTTIGTATANPLESGPAQAPLRAGHGDSSHVTGATAQASAGSSGTYPISEQSEAARSVSDGRALGLSGEHLLYILLALGVLVFTGVLTKRMAHNVPVRTHE
jgi:hypothetical protein